MPHSVRLRHPWKVSVGDRTQLFQRSFNSPTGLHENQSVVLVIEMVDPELSLKTVRINGRELQRGQDVAGWRAEVSKDLISHNQISVEISHAPEAELSNNIETLFEVRIEIDE